MRKKGEELKAATRADFEAGGLVTRRLELLKAELKIADHDDHHSQIPIIYHSTERAVLEEKSALRVNHVSRCMV